MGYVELTWSLSVEKEGDAFWLLDGGRRRREQKAFVLHLFCFWYHSRKPFSRTELYYSFERFRPSLGVVLPFSWNELYYFSERVRLSFGVLLNRPSSSFVPFSKRSHPSFLNGNKRKNKFLETLREWVAMRGGVWNHPDESFKLTDTRNSTILLTMRPLGTMWLQGFKEFKLVGFQNHILTLVKLCLRNSPNSQILISSDHLKGNTLPL